MTIGKETIMKQSMKKLGSVFILSFIFFSSMASAEIRVTSILDSIRQSIEKTDKQTLVIFDIDDVVIIAEDQILQPQNKTELDELNKKLKENRSENDAQKLWSIAFQSRKSKLIDPNILEIFKILKARAIKTILLTNAWTGPFGKIAALEDWRIQEMKNLGIDLSWSFPNVHTIVFKDIAKEAAYPLETTVSNSVKSKENQDPNRLPVFKQGVLLTSNRAKGYLLKAFLEKIHWHPKRIIFIDDKLKNLKSVRDFCDQAGIEFLGFHYTSVENRKTVPLNKERAKCQFEVLEKEEKWLGDQEADAYCHSETRGSKLEKKN